LDFDLLNFFWFSLCRTKGKGKSSSTSLCLSDVNEGLDEEDWLLVDVEWKKGGQTKIFVVVGNSTH
jgi:hypothetical protein